MQRAFFITATGTDIGKTFVSAALAHQGKGAWQAIKPVISGYNESYDSDASILLASQPGAALESICPWRFAAPISLHLAAKREGRTLPFNELLVFCQEKIAQRPTLIEGVGGVMSPIDDTRTVLDWIRALDIPVILVTGTYLGTLSHTLTAISVLTQAGASVHAIIVSAGKCGDEALADTVASLRQFCPDIRHIHALSQQESWQTAPPMLDWLA